MQHISYRKRTWQASKQTNNEHIQTNATAGRSIFSQSSPPGLAKREIEICAYDDDDDEDAKKEQDEEAREAFATTYIPNLYGPRPPMIREREVLGRGESR